MDRLIGVWFWVGVGLVGTLALFFGAWAITRWLRRRIEHSDTAAPFTLADLRAMRAAGSISEAEFRSMKSAIIAELGGTPRAKD